MKIFCTDNTSESEYALLVEWLYMAQLENDSNPDVGFPISKESLLERLPMQMSNTVRDEIIRRYAKKYSN